MSNRFQSGKKYIVDGGLLEEINRKLDTLRILPTNFVRPTILPGQGTQLFSTALPDAPYREWDLVPTDDDSGGYGVAVGSLLDGTDEHNGTIPCSNPTDTFSPVAGGCLLLKIVGKAPTSFSLELESSWPIDNDTFVETTGDPLEEVFSYRVLPVWYFYGSEGDFRLELNPALYARPAILRGANLRLINAYHQVPDGARLQVPEFEYYTAAI